MREVTLGAHVADLGLEEVLAELGLKEAVEGGKRARSLPIAGRLIS